MYIRNYNDPKRNASRPLRQTAQGAEAQDFLPPDYGGVAYGRTQIPEEGSGGPPGAENGYSAGDGTGLKEGGLPRFPLASGERDAEQDRELRPARGAAGKSVTVEDLLLCALIMLMLDAGADDEILLILGFLLIAGLR